MDTKTLVVGQAVVVNGGFGPIDGTVIRIEPLSVLIDMGNGLIRVNSDGEECGPDGKAYAHEFDPTFGPGPWKIVESALRLKA